MELKEQLIGCKTVTKWSTADCQLFYSSTINIEQWLSRKKCMKLENFVQKSKENELTQWNNIYMRTLYAGKFNIILMVDLSGFQKSNFLPKKFCIRVPLILRTQYILC
jgi:hypothetical protein